MPNTRPNGLTKSQRDHNWRLSAVIFWPRTPLEKIFSHENHMYVSTPVVGEVTDAASKFIMDNDRLAFRPFYDAAEAFCADNKIIFGGQIGVDLLLGRALTPTSQPWDLYVAGAFSVAKNFVIALANARSPHVPARTTVLLTKLKNVEYSIQVASRELFRVRALEPYRGVDVAQLMAPVTRRGFFGRDVLCLPAELQLISIYQTLYTPAKNGKWAETIADEMALWGDRSGGRRGKNHREKNHHHAADPAVFARKFDMIAKLTADDILIGDHAASARPAACSRVQFISARTPAEICAGLNGAGVARSTHGGLNFTYANFALCIDDFRLTKHTIYVSNGRDQHPVADVFNASAHEMIPWVAGTSARQGNVWVLLRFSMIDIWSLRMIAALSKKNLDERIREIQARVAGLRQRALADLASTFQLTGYVGVFLDPAVAKSQLIKKLGLNFPPFYPAKGGGNMAGDVAASVVTGVVNGVVSGVVGNIVGNVAGKVVESMCATSAPKGAQCNLIESSPVDFSVDPTTKQRILLKVTRKPATSEAPADILARLKEWQAEMRGDASTVQWGIGKTLRSFYFKNAVFLPWIPARINNYVDIGCGDGLDVVALGQRYRIGSSTCADIADHRDEKHRRGKFVKVELGRPLAIPDNTADLVVVFHSIHHMREDVPTRLADIVRITTPGGLIFIKDHDVKNRLEASNVDFEHLAYLVADRNEPVEQLAREFPTFEPMTYLPASRVNEIMLAAGTERVFHGEINKRTYVYGSVYRKK